MNEINRMELISELNRMSAAARGEQAVSGSEGIMNRDFIEILQNSVNQVNSAQQSSARLAQAFQSGDPNIAISDVMIASQKSSIAFTAMTQVRNRLVSAYQEIMSMQV
jgi:flagellar hook-basal body complex protein FliE